MKLAELGAKAKGIGEYKLQWVIAVSLGPSRLRRWGSIGGHAFSPLSRAVANHDDSIDLLSLSPGFVGCTSHLLAECMPGGDECSKPRDFP